MSNPLDQLYRRPTNPHVTEYVTVEAATPICRHEDLYVKIKGAFISIGTLEATDPQPFQGIAAADDLIKQLHWDQDDKNADEYMELEINEAASESDAELSSSAGEDRGYLNVSEEMGSVSDE